MNPVFYNSGDTVLTPSAMSAKDVKRVPFGGQSDDEDFIFLDSGIDPKGGVPRLVHLQPSSYYRQHSLKSTSSTENEDDFFLDGMSRRGSMGDDDIEVSAGFVGFLLQPGLMKDLLNFQKVLKMYWQIWPECFKIYRPSKIFTGPGLLAVVFHKPCLHAIGSL